ncbi:MAG: hypothetical protein KJ749_12885, partial [Planctomycetes bacterium]|nr:hypothetical protein [Planctomycetota bacterium]
MPNTTGYCEAKMEVCQSPETAVARASSDIPCLFPASRISERVEELAREISADYADQSIMVVGVLHGAYVFMADLVRHLTIPVRCGFVMASSYGHNTVTSGQLALHLDLIHPAKGEHLLLVDDIVDTGTSTAWLIDHLRQKDPASIRLCTLLDKPSRRRVPVTIDYTGF